MNNAIATYTKLPPPNLTVDVTPQQIKFWIDISKDQDLIKGNPDPASVIFNP